MKKIPQTLLTVLALAALQACTSVPMENAKLTAAQAEFKTAQNTPEIPALASAELRDAEVTLEQARVAWTAQQSRTEVDHLAYLASKKVSIAQATASQRQAEKTVADARGNRQQTLLAARTQEAQSAQRTAELATQQAQTSAGQTAIAQQDALSAQAMTAQLQARLSELDAKQTDRGMVVTIGDLLFDTNSAVLKPGAGQSVQRLGAFLKTYPMRNALIEGYTDSVGSASNNQSLSERRADSVKNALLAEGVVSTRMVVRGYGEGYPVGSNLSADGRLSNRRVEVILSDDSGMNKPR